MGKFKKAIAVFVLRAASRLAVRLLSNDLKKLPR